MPQVAKPTKIEPGILSCLTSLNIDDVSQYKEKETPTPSGIAECKINIMKMLDDSVSSKPIMQKTAENTNCKNSNKERTSFSTYIKQNSFNDTSNMYFNMNVNMNVINSHPVNIFNSYNTFNDNTFDINNNLTYNNIFQMNPFIYNSNLQIKNKQRYYSSMSLSQIVENSNIISRDQSGCRYLQKILTENPSIAPQLLKNAFEKIYEIKNITCKVKPVTSEEFPRPAKRPLNSQMSKDKLLKNGIIIPTYEEALKRYLENE